MYGISIFVWFIFEFCFASECANFLIHTNISICISSKIALKKMKWIFKSMQKECKTHSLPATAEKCYYYIRHDLWLRINWVTFRLNLSASPLLHSHSLAIRLIFSIFKKFIFFYRNNLLDYRNSFFLALHTLSTPYQIIKDSAITNVVWIVHACTMMCHCERLFLYIYIQKIKFQPIERGNNYYYCFSSPYCCRWFRRHHLLARQMSSCWIQLCWHKY